MKTIRVHMSNNFHKRVNVPPGTTAAELVEKCGSADGYLSDALGNEIPGGTDLHEAMYEDQDVLVCGRTNLDSERARLQGTPFSKLIERHVRRAKLAELLQEYTNTPQLLCKHVPRTAQDQLHARWTAETKKGQIWTKDASQIFDFVVSEARAILDESGVAYDNKDLYGLFYWTTLGCATAAAMSKEFREQMGIRKSFFSR